MSPTLRILPVAESDVDSAAQYLYDESLELALTFYDAVEKTYKRIARQPRTYARVSLGPPHLRGFRHRTVIGFPQHVIFFRIVGAHVEIARVLHGARDLPAVWHA